jgi:hypothetical protein
MWYGVINLQKTISGFDSHSVTSPYAEGELENVDVCHKNVAWYDCVCSLLHFKYTKWGFCAKCAYTVIIVHGIAFSVPVHSGSLFNIIEYFLWLGRAITVLYFSVIVSKAFAKDTHFCQNSLKHFKISFEGNIDMS